MRGLNSLKESLIRILMGSSEMNRKQYILSILGVLFSGMILGFIVIVCAPCSLFYITESNFETWGVAFIVISVLSGIFVNKLSEKIKNGQSWKLFLEIIGYYLFWIFACSFYGCCYMALDDIGWIIPAFYAMGVVITLVCLSVGLLLPQRSKKLAIIPGIVAIIIVIVLIENIVHPDSIWVIFAFVVVGIFYCFFFIYQINKLKFDKIEDNSVRRWASIFNTDVDMGLTFITMLGAMLALFFKNEDDN